MRVLEFIRENLFWFLLPMLIAVLVVVITLFVMGEFSPDETSADFVYPI